MQQEREQKEKLNQDMQDFLRDCVAGRALDRRTEKAYRGDLSCFCAWLRTQADSTVTGAQVESYLNALQQEQQAKASTVMRKYRVFRQYLNYLASTGRAHRDSCTLHRPVYGEEEVRSARSRPLSRQETDRLFEAIEVYYNSLDSAFFKRVCLRDKVMLKLLYYHDVEVSEITSMRVADYDRKTHMLTIRRKRGGAQREEVFARDLKQDLAGWLDAHELFERDPAYTDYLFLSKVGRPLSMQMLVKIFDKYRTLAGIGKNASAKTLKISMQQYARELMMERCR